MEPEFEDKQLQEILSKGRKKMPFHDFEDDLMIEIHKDFDRKRSVLKNIKLSWFFFITGLISGITLFSIPSILNETSPELKTPAIDQLASEGVKFTQAFACHPMC